MALFSTNYLKPGKETSSTVTAMAGAETESLRCLRYSLRRLSHTLEKFIPVVDDAVETLERNPA